jgi:hypothetical protein
VRVEKYPEFSHPRHLGPRKERYWDPAIPLPRLQRPLRVAAHEFQAVEVRTLPQVPSNGTEHLVRALLQSSAAYAHDDPPGGSAVSMRTVPLQFCELSGLPGTILMA